jgi:hypothetical protein
MRGRTPKHSNLAATSAVALSVAIVMMAGPLRASEFSDFRIPENRSYSLGAGVFGTGGFNRNQSPLASYRFSALDGLLQMSGGWTLDADDRFYSIRASIAGSVGSRSEDRSDNATVFAPMSYSVRNTEEQDTDVNANSWRVDVAARQYPFAIPIGFGFSGHAELEDAASEQERESNGWFTDATGTNSSRSETEIEVDHYRHVLVGTATLGWGKVRNAAGVFDAHLLERRLLRGGAIHRPLSVETRRRIAALYYLRPDFSIPHDRPDRYFWREIERVLREDPALEDGSLSAFELFRIAESYVAPSSARSRLVGWYVGAIAEIVGSRDLNRSTGRIHSRLFHEDSLINEVTYDLSERRSFVNEVPRVGAEARLEAPIGDRLQLSAAGSLVSPPRDFGDAFEGNTEARALFFVADRWGLEGRASHRRRIGEPASFGRASDWITEYGAEVQFYAEDRLFFRLGVIETEAAARFAEGRQYGRRGALVLGVQYGFGGHDAPGLFEPMRSLSISGGTHGW